jgi:hypothetical protein
VDPTDTRVTGIVDWGAARPDGPPDLQLLLLTTRATASRRHLGPLEGRLWTSAERRLLAGTAWSWPDASVEDPALALLAWLSQVSSVLDKRPAYAFDHRWMVHIVSPVLSRIVAS